MKISDTTNPNHGGHGVTTQRDNEHLISSDLTPSMVAAFLAVESRIKLQRATDESNGDSSISTENNSKVSPKVVRVKYQKHTKSIIKKFQHRNLEEQKDEMLMSLVNEVSDLKIQVKERKKLTDEKAMPAAKRLSDNHNELKKLITEIEKINNERINEEKSTLDIDHPTMKNLIEVETTLSQASAQVDRSIMVVTQLELENLEIKSEIEAAKLSASESITKRLEASKMEKKHLKKISTWEKQRGKLYEDITSEKQKLMEIQEEILQVEASRKTFEAKWREQQESKKEALTRVKHERRLKEESESNKKRSRESLHAKMDLDFKRHKDEIQRLEQELSRVKSLTNSGRDLTSVFGSDFEDEAIGKLLHGCCDEEDSEEDVVDHECVICEENEACVVFLPCAHEVVCVDCNEKLNKDECPTCGVVIKQRIRVFGGSC